MYVDIFSPHHTKQPRRRPQGGDVNPERDIKRLFQNYCYCVHEEKWIYTVDYQCGDSIAVCEKCLEKYGDQCPFHKIGRNVS